jgi:GT2 family glycosyltransferase
MPGMPLPQQGGKATVSTYPDLTISIISADNLNLLLPCLRSVFAATHKASLEVFVVDNASSDNTASSVQAEFPQVTVIRNSTRLGFSTNNNMVLRQGRGRYLMLLNDDTLVLEGALDNMIDYMERQPTAGAVGGNLLNADGTYQLAVSRFPNPMLEALFPAFNWYGRRIFRSKTPVAVDCVSGGAMLIRRKVMESVGVLDTSFDPIYSEEIDWCYRIKKAGWDIFMIPTAPIIHYGGQTMNRAVATKYELLLGHKMLFYRKHGGRISASLFRLFLYFAVVAKLLWWRILGLHPQKRTGSVEKTQLNLYLLQRIRVL